MRFGYTAALFTCTPVVLFDCWLAAGL